MKSALELDLCRTDLSRQGSDLANGFLDDGLYCTGWFRRGPTGTIPDNRADAKHVADNIVQAVKSGALGLGKPGYSAIAEAIKSTTVRYEDWKRIDTAELQKCPLWPRAPKIPQQGCHVGRSPVPSSRRKQ